MFYCFEVIPSINHPDRDILIHIAIDIFLSISIIGLSLISHINTRNIDNCEVYCFTDMHVHISFPTGNVAYLKRTRLSTPYRDFDASYAVDGVTWTEAGDNAAAWNTDTTSPAWWMVDLEINHQIHETYIYNTNGPFSE